MNKLNFCCRSKPISVLIELNNSSQNKYSSQLARQIDCTYPHIRIILEKLKEGGFVVFNNIKNKKFVKITDKGKEIAKHFIEIQKIVGDSNVMKGGKNNEN